MGNCISRRHSPMPESGEQPYSVDEAIASGSPFENVAGSASNVMPGPDLVAVKLRCSCNLGCIEEEHLKALLKSLHDKMTSFQWSLCALFQESVTVSPSSPATGEAPELKINECFCSTYPKSGSVWPSGVTDTTNTVMIELWIQSTSMNKPPKQVSEYVSDAVGFWISNTLNISDKVWIISRYSVPTGKSGSFEKVEGKGYQNGKSQS